jgi:hypothetical protein
VTQARHTRPPTTASTVARTACVRVVARSDAGVSVLAATGPAGAGGAPVGSGGWARSLRVFSRAALWLLPAYGLLYALSTMGDLEGGPAGYVAHDQHARLIGWVFAICAGLIALLALAALHAASPARLAAMWGLVTGLCGAGLMLPFATLSGRTAVGPLPAGVFSTLGATFYSAGWLLVGWAVVRSRILSRVDGVLLMVSAPMIGVLGLLIGPLQTVGALLLLAAGIGVVWVVRRPAQAASPEEDGFVAER